LGAALAIFIVFPLILRKRMMSRMRGSSGSGSGFGFGGLFGQGQGTGVKYVCLTCNHQFKGGDCPRCGSKMKRADF
jgi:rubrerythrin